LPAGIGKSGMGIPRGFQGDPLARHYIIQRVAIKRRYFSLSFRFLCYLNEQSYLSLMWKIFGLLHLHCLDWFPSHIEIFFFFRLCILSGPLEYEWKGLVGRGLLAALCLLLCIMYYDYVWISFVVIVCSSLWVLRVL